MKSTNEDLMKRGFITEEYINKFQSYSDEELLELVNSSKAVERSVSINLMSKRYGVENKEFVEFLLGKLCVEKSLYTKIEICSALEKGNIYTAKQMIKYLGIIGNNQHKCLPDRVSKKKSYPLARDIIARSLARMNVEVLPVLFDVLESDDRIKISEVIDAIGFMIFYNQETSNEYYFKKIVSVMEKYLEDDLIIWKCIMCLSSFKTQESIDILEQVLYSDKNDLIKNEAECSLSKIRKEIKL
ncbi:HEAT repeat domain-containing protein [Clostridioides sp. ZZV15-6598]|uniref:HEAT repeat domain-containing protein n=1 Tax=Clostridioides sp. ZZV15-6598 TaxID=2811501 RepID=UPI001D0FDF8E|nr:HEAT repeat domain-containing protein [Clostridioides sp. ZZV15-6598]